MNGGLSDLEEDKMKLTQSLELAKAQLYRVEGALMFVNDNIKKLKEGKDDREQSNNKS